MMSGNTLQITV